MSDGDEMVPDLWQMLSVARRSALLVTLGQMTLRRLRSGSALEEKADDAL
jgi:hypothetical protein